MEYGKMRPQMDRYDHPTGTVFIKWVSEQTGPGGEPLHQRYPKAKKEKFTTDTGFEAGGRQYRRIEELCAKKTEKEDLCLDIYGREVLCLRERFPCFDSYDRLYEHRYFRWYLLWNDGEFVMVYHADESRDIEVTTDVKGVKERWWQKAKTVWNVE